MKTLSCEMCGSTNLIKDGGVFVCQSCGTKYSLEEAKKMMADGPVEVQGTVKIDSSKELDNLYSLARRAKDSDNHENAAKYYDMILLKDPDSWEANFYTVFFKAMVCKIGDISSEAQNVENCLKPVMELIMKTVTDITEQKKVITEVALRTLSISRMLFNGGLNHYKKFSTVAGQANESANDLFFSGRISYGLGDVLEEMFGDEYKDLCVRSWTQGIEMFNDSRDAYIQASGNILTPQTNNAQLYQQKIQKINPQSSAPEVKAGGCVVLLVIGLSPLLALAGYFISTIV